jgi:6-phospho-3-hexuloisomerase
VNATNTRSELILAELTELFRRFDDDALTAVGEAIVASDRVFLTGLGRSRLIAAAFAMRLMHVGFDSHLVGEVTAPALSSGDLLIAQSGSGTTPTTVHQARAAKEAGAQVAAITSQMNSPLGQLADLTVVVPVGGQDGVATAQHAGSLFEQSCLIVADSVAALLQQRLARTDTDRAARHANLQ